MGDPSRTLVVSPLRSHPVAGGAVSRLHHLVETLAAWGHQVEYAYVPMLSGPATPAMAAYWGDRLHVVPGCLPEAMAQVPVGSGLRARWRHQIRYRAAWAESGLRRCLVGRWDAWYTAETARFLRDLQRRRRFDSVVVQYAIFSKAFLPFGDSCLRLLDTIDVYAGRAELMGRFGLPSKWSSTPEEEGRQLDRADIILAITGEDAGSFARRTRRPIRVVGHLAPPWTGFREPPEDPCLVFVGSDNAMNRQAARLLVEKIFPRIRARLPQTRLMVAGDVCRGLAPTEQCTLLGPVADLGSIYAKSTLAVLPLQVGTGLAIKCVEALGHGVPVVASRIAARGLLHPATPALTIADDETAMVEAAVQVLQTPHRWPALAQEAQRFAGAYRQQALTGLRSCFEPASPVPRPENWPAGELTWVN